MWTTGWLALSFNWLFRSFRMSPIAHLSNPTHQSGEYLCVWNLIKKEEVKTIDQLPRRNSSGFGSSWRQLLLQKSPFRLHFGERDITCLFSQTCATRHLVTSWTSIQKPWTPKSTAGFSAGIGHPFRWCHLQNSHRESRFHFLPFFRRFLLGRYDPSSLHPRILILVLNRRKMIAELKKRMPKPIWFSHSLYLFF